MTVTMTMTMTVMVMVMVMVSGMIQHDLRRRRM